MPAALRMARDFGPARPRAVCFAEMSVDFHVVHDDVMVESSNDLLDLTAIGFHHQPLASVIDEHIAENAALRVEQESIDAASGGEIANVVRNHAIQPAHAVAAGQ